MPTAVKRNLQRASQSRVFTIEDRAGPSHAPLYQALARVLAVTKPFGGITPVRIADPNKYGSFLTVDKIKGQPALPSTSIELRTTRDRSAMLKLAAKGCAIDLHIHIGACKDPSDFDQGWEKIGVLEDADFTEWTTSALGAMDSDQENSSTETLPITGTDYYEIGPLGFAEIGSSQITQEVIGVTICDSRSCGACGLPSDGTLRIFAVQKTVGASPGMAAEVISSVNGGVTWVEQNITTLAANKNPSAIACVGPYIAVLSQDACEVHYALITDLLAGTSSWTKQVTGLTCAAGSPRAIFSISRTQTWVVGDGGYIYKTTDITTGFTPQSAGAATAQNLYAIHGLDEDNILTVGATNAIVRTRNGGDTWELVAGPVGQAAVTATACFMLSELEWFIGYADGKLYYTSDGGASWSQKLIPGSLTAIDAIQFPTRTVGYLAGHTAATGKILRSISGGYSWYVLPEVVGQTIPTALTWNGIATTGDEPNMVLAGGVKTLAGDGILIKGAG